MGGKQLLLILAVKPAPTEEIPLEQVGILHNLDPTK